MDEIKSPRIIKPQKGFQERFSRSSVSTCFGGGVLNPQPLDSLISTPDGFVRIDDINVGDVIHGILNKEQTIVHKTYEGEKNCIKITLIDGSAAESALDHKWIIHKEGRGEFAAMSWEILEAFQILKENDKNIDLSFYRYDPIKEEKYKVSLLDCEDIGMKEVVCIGVSNDDELYITDNNIITKNCGKTFAAILMVAEPSLDPKFRACFTRRNISNLKIGGGILDDFKTAYGDNVQIKLSDTPRVLFPSGAYVDCLHIADEEPSKLMERLKGTQIDLAYMDELTSYLYTSFTILGTRIRGKSDIFTGHIFGTTNPKRSHWTRRWLDLYIGVDGFVKPEMDGVVTYYYQMGEKVEDVQWGFSVDEVYAKCRVDIDRKISKLGKAFSYKDMVRSFVFYAGVMSENLESIGNNKGYAGAVAAVGGRRGQQLIEGNFNVDEDEDLDAPINPTAANEVFFNDPQVNGDKWITADLADYGNDNLCIVAWDCFHIIDIMIIGQSTPRQNAERVQLMAERHKVGDDHIIFDATAAMYMRDYIPDSIPYRAASQPIGLYGRMAFILKDECYQRLVQMICKGLISCEEEVALRPYVHVKLKQEITVQTEFLEECSVVRFKEVGSGKKRLMNKKEMNQMLGKGRSMDLLDACAMRMYPILGYELGSELENTMPEYVEEETDVFGRRSIYDNSTWA